MTKYLDESQYTQLVSIRRHLHQHPEVSGAENETANYIMETLRSQFAPDELLTELGGTGIAACYRGIKEGPTVLFRAELDALPIAEENDDLDYRSQRPGVSHKCGHDGHMTILLGLASYLSANPPEKGQVVLLFQPSEENGAGASKVLEDERFQVIQPDCVYAFHNLPGYPLGQIILKEGPFTAAVNSIICRLIGKTSHAGDPTSGVNPAMAISRIVAKVNELNQPDRSRTDFRVYTPIHLIMGEKAYGTSAGYGEVHYTLRTRNEETMARSEEEMLKLVADIARNEKLKLRVDYTDRFYGNANDQHAIERIAAVAEELGYETTYLEDPLSFGEDFGAFTQKFSGAMFCIGSGEETPALHNPDYDFPDQLIDIGVRMFASIADQYTRT